MYTTVTADDQTEILWNNLEPETIYDIIATFSKASNLGEHTVYGIFKATNPKVLTGTRDNGSVYYTIHPDSVQDMRTKFKWELALKRKKEARK